MLSHRADQEAWLWFRRDHKPPSDAVALGRSRGVTMVQMWPQVPKWCCGFTPIKRWCYDSDTTKPPSDYCELCSRGTYVWAVLLQQTLFGPFNFPENSNLREIILFEPEVLKPDTESFKALWEIAFPWTGFQTGILPFKPEIFWRPLNLHQYGGLGSCIR